MTLDYITRALSIPEFLEHTYGLWLEYPYSYRAGERLMGATYISPEVLESGHALNVNDLMELAASTLSQGAACGLTNQILNQGGAEVWDWLRPYKTGHHPALDSDEAREATRQAALKLNPGYDTPPWQGETVDELQVWMIRWLLRARVARLLKQSNYHGQHRRPVPSAAEST